MPIITDSILLAHIVIERIEHSRSRLRLVMSMAPPVFLKFGRLVNTAILIVACAEFVLSSVTSGDGIPDMDILDAAQARSMQISGALQMVDNSSVNFLYPDGFSITSRRVLRYQLVLYYLNAFDQRRKAMQGLALCASFLCMARAECAPGQAHVQV